MPSVSYSWAANLKVWIGIECFSKCCYTFMKDPILWHLNLFQCPYCLYNNKAYKHNKIMS